LFGLGLFLGELLSRGELGWSMVTETLERLRICDFGLGFGGNWLVIVFNDDYNIFDWKLDRVVY